MSLQELESGQAEAGSLELLGLPHGQQGLRSSGHHLLPPQLCEAGSWIRSVEELGLEVALNMAPPIQDPNLCPNVCPESCF